MQEIKLSSNYICPIRGLTGFESPESERLGEAAKISRELGLERLFFPLLEGAMVSSVRTKIAYLDGMVQALDRMEEIGVEAWLIAPARRVMRIDWVPPYLIRGSIDPKGPRVFIDGKVRQVRPYNWWKDLSIIEKRIRIFRDVISALTGHPAIAGWNIMDRALDWPRPEPGEIEWVYQSYLSEIRDRDEVISVYGGFGWSELLQPEMARSLIHKLDGIRLSGLDSKPQNLRLTQDLGGELQLATYLGALAGWLLETSLEVEVGWSTFQEADEDEILETAGQLAEIGIAGLCWSNLVDPERGLQPYPPWNLEAGLNHLGLLHPALEPKEWVAELIKEVKTSKALENPYGFIDIDQNEYLDDPQIHFTRLWDHFREFIS
jgi:hypothetical protein